MHHTPTADVGPVIVRSVGASFLRVTENDSYTAGGVYIIRCHDVSVISPT